MNGNGVWQKISIGAVTILASLALAWTASQSSDDHKQDKRLDANEENIRTIHYEAQVQRKLLESIAVAVDAKTGPVLPVRQLRKAGE
jgi:ABC-type Zn uptake system ZnuABC Zn-binding protein ZnuA